MNRPPHIAGLVPRLAASSVVLFLCGQVFAAESAAPSTPDPEGVVFNPAMGTYTVQRAPTRTLDEVLKSFAGWQRQVLPDGSEAHYAFEDGILSMECSGCGLERPSAIDVTTIDIKTLMAYQAGTWHIGVRSADGTQDFFGVLPGEIGSGPHDPAQVAGHKQIALTALGDLHDLLQLTLNPASPSTQASSPASSASSPAPSKPSPPAKSAAAPKPGAINLSALASSGDVEAIQAHKGATPREIQTALETAYGARARSQLLAGDVDSALQTLGEGRRKFGKSASLREREAHYVVVGDAYDRVRLAVKLDVASMRQFLQQIQSLEPADVTSIEQMLALTLAHRIADQRAAGRGTVADELLQSGQELFPPWAQVLSQGAAGALPQGGVELGTTAGAADHGK